MTQALKTSKSIIMLMRGKLEQTIQRLADEFNIVLSETDDSGISYEKELQGNNESFRLEYLHDMIIPGYEIITITQKDNTFEICKCEEKYTIRLNATGQLLYSGAKKPRTTDVEKQLDFTIRMKKEIQEKPQEKHELGVYIEKNNLDSISQKTIKKYLS